MRNILLSTCHAYLVFCPKNPTPSPPNQIGPMKIGLRIDDIHRFFSAEIIAIRRTLEKSAYPILPTLFMLTTIKVQRGRSSQPSRFLSLVFSVRLPSQPRWLKPLQRRRLTKFR